MHSPGSTLLDLEAFIAAWLADCEARGLSPQTLQIRRHHSAKLLWFLRQHGHETCGTGELRGFLAYVGKAHPEGRWPTEKTSGRRGRPQPVTVRPSTTRGYYRSLTALFAFCVMDGLIEESPMSRIRPPIARTDQLVPLTVEEVGALITAARTGAHASRDLAVLLFALDTCVRASELCSIRTRDIDLAHSVCVVKGKGGRQRPVYVGSRATEALRQALLGHQDLRMTKRYVMVTDADVAAQHRAHSPVDSLGLVD